MSSPEESEIQARPVPPGPEELRWLERGLRSIGFFSSLGRAQLAAVLPFMLMVEYPKNYVICEEGGVGDDFYLIYQGRVRITKKGWSRPVASLSDGEFFGEMSLLFHQPRSASATTEERSLLFCLSSENFDRMLEQHPEMAQTIRALAEARRLELARS